MFSNLRRHFGTAGLLVAVVALVAALGGSAIAANGGGSGDATASAKRGGNVNKLIKREARKFSKVFSQRFSKRFAVPGPVGPQGFPGIPGPEGPKGDDGDDGSNGSNGSNGAPGKSVEVSAAACGGLGGAEVKEEGAGSGVEVCNGEKGDKGDPWTVGGTLPEGATLTGVYMVPEDTGAGLGYGSMDDGAVSGPLQVSFEIPVEPAPSFVFVPGDAEAEAYGSDAGEGCPGVVGGVPQADPGIFCVYGWAEEFDIFGPIESADVAAKKPDGESLSVSDGVTPAGTLLQADCTAPEAEGIPFCYAKGVWAVGGH